MEVKKDKGESGSDFKEKVKGESESENDKDDSCLVSFVPTPAKEILNK